MMKAIIALFVSISFFNCSANPIAVNSVKEDSILIANYNSLFELYRLHNAMTTAELNIYKWTDTPGQAAFKLEHTLFIKTDYAELKKKVSDVSGSWSNENKERLKKLLQLNDEIFALHLEIMDELKQFSDYNDPVKLIPVKTMLDVDGDLPLKTRRAVELIVQLENYFKKQIPAR